MKTPLQNELLQEANQIRGIDTRLRQIDHRMRKLNKRKSEIERKGG